MTINPIVRSLHGANLFGLSADNNVVAPQATKMEFADEKELEILESLSVAASGALTIGSKVVIPAPAVGTVAGTGVTVVESGSGILNKTVLTFTDVDVALTDNAGTVAYGGLKVYDFPAGAILILGAVADLDLTKSSAGVNADWDGDFGVGTVTAGNNNALATTEQNIIPTTATPQAVAGVTTANGQSTATENAVIDGTSTAVDAYLNILVDDADHDVTSTPCNIIVNGTLTLHWINLGDY